jgi:hypothetical protein
MVSADETVDFNLWRVQKRQAGSHHFEIMQPRMAELRLVVAHVRWANWKLSSDQSGKWHETA